MRILALVLIICGLLSGCSTTNDVKQAPTPHKAKCGTNCAPDIPDIGLEYGLATMVSGFYPGYGGTTERLLIDLKEQTITCSIERTNKDGITKESISHGVVPNDQSMIKSFEAVWALPQKIPYWGESHAMWSISMWKNGQTRHETSVKNTDLLSIIQKARIACSVMP